MPLLRPACSYSLGAACARATRSSSSAQTRFLSYSVRHAAKSTNTTPDATPAAPPTAGSMINKETPGEAMTRHQPDYNATIDQGTSTFSPIPKRVMDGSESTGAVAAAVLSGAPTNLQARTVRIYRLSKPATQSGTWHGHDWRMDWDVLGKGHRWENPLMGWQSSADEMQGTNINFNSKEDAIRFAEKQGYEYYVQEPNERSFRPKSYANNFLHSPNKLKIIRTK